MLVEKVIAGNENFEKKNVYSKQKYVRRKQQKFLKWFCPRAPTTRLLAEHFNRKEKDPGRMLDLRIDTLSQLLGHANVFAGGKYMIWDDSLGFTTGALLSRMDLRDGTVMVAIHTQSTLQTPFLQYFNLGEHQKGCLLGVHLSEIGPDPMPALPDHFNPSTEDNDEHKAKHIQRTQEREARRQRARVLFDAQAFTSIVLVCGDTTDPATLLSRFGPFLAPSGRLVIHCKYREPLLPAFIQARYNTNPTFVDVSLTESWMRPYQTAAGRLHPEMGLPGSSGAGYMLTATLVIDRG